MRNHAKTSGFSGRATQMQSGAVTLDARSSTRSCGCAGQGCRDRHELSAAREHSPVRDVRFGCEPASRCRYSRRLGHSHPSTLSAGRHRSLDARLRRRVCARREATDGRFDLQLSMARADQHQRTRNGGERPMRTLREGGLDRRHHVAATNGNVRAGDESRQVGSQKRHRVGHVLIGSAAP